MNYASQFEEMEKYKGQVVYVERLPSRSAQFGSLIDPLPKEIEDFLTKKNISLWSHQTEVVEAVRRKENVILSTSTASGKTLAFNLPTFERLIEDPLASALYLYPLKALANDQAEEIKTMEKALGIKTNSAIYDGDTSQSKRANIRNKSRIILSNPYALHQYLPNSHLWERFFSNLSVVIVDEAHWYRGVFGSNFAMLMRRLRRIAARYGSDPTFILASATIGNPKQHAESLIGKPFVEVSNDGAPHGPKEFILWNPINDPNKSMYSQTSQLVAHLAKTKKSSICFTVSRRMTELVAKWAQQEAPKSKIISYQGGYLPHERREIEASLRNGKVDAVVSTNALELGIDIGGLEVAVIAGYPGTICSTWQQAGRAGRSNSPSAAVLVGFEGPLDQYIMSHPNELFAKPHEEAVVDLFNPLILSGHIMCASAEVLITEKDERFFGPLMFKALEELQEKNLLAKTDIGWTFQGTFRPVDTVNLAAIGSNVFQVRVGNTVLETMSQRQVFSLAHPGAILTHRGEDFRIVSLDLEQKIATAEPDKVDYYTESLSRVDIDILNERESKTVGRSRLVIGDVRVREQFSAYKIIKGDSVLDILPLDLPQIEFETVAYWLVMPNDLRNEVISMKINDNESRSYAGGLHAAEHALIHMMPLLSMCDPKDVGGLSTENYFSMGKSVIFVYDGFPGGIGIAEKAYENYERLALITLDLVSQCSCETGCPSCVFDRNCGNDNSPLDRLAAAVVLKATL